MKKLLIIISALFVFGTTSAQVRDSFELRSIPVLDMNGNLYEVVKYYDHIPTYRDSVKFKKESSVELRKMINETKAVTQRKNYRKRNTKQKPC